MENASKALLLAGSVLMAVIVIAALVYMFGQLSNAQQTKADVDELSKITEYGKRFEQFNKTIHGAELLSLANLQSDYNATQSEESGYTEIQIRVKLDYNISDEQTTYFRAGNTYDIQEFSEKITKYSSNNSSVENLIIKYEEQTDSRGKTIQDYAQMSYREIAIEYFPDIDFTSSDDTDYDVGELLAGRMGNVSTSQSRKLMKDIEKYKSLKSLYTEFKNKSFKCKDVGYDINGRINSMYFEEN